MLEGAINSRPDIPGFIEKFHPSFPVGIANEMAAVNYLGLNPSVRSFVPFLLLIDRRGTIRAQFTGGDRGFFDKDMDEHIRKEALKVLNEPRNSRVATKKSN